jgi:hypothetical protein
MRNIVRRADAYNATACLPAEMLERTCEEKYPAYVGVLIAIVASALLWAIIASVFAALF